MLQHILNTIEVEKKESVDKSSYELETGNWFGFSTYSWAELP